MRRLITTCMVALLGLAVPVAASLRADDSHHPEKAAKVKKVMKGKPSQQKKPAKKEGRQDKAKLSSAGYIKRETCVAGGDLNSSVLCASAMTEKKSVD